MKKLSQERIEWLERHRLRSARAKLRQRAKAAARRKGDRRYKIFVETQEGRRRAWAASRIPMPAIFCLEENFEECAKCLSRLRESLSRSIERIRDGSGPIQRKRRVPSFMDFSTIRKCTPAAALALAAEYDRARTLMPWNIRLINSQHWRRELVELLEEIGFFDLLEIPRVKRKGKRSEMEVVPFKTGDTFGNEEAGSLTHTLAQMIVAADPQGIMDDDILPARMALYAALVEACENTCLHAYSKTEGPGSSVRRWWMTGAVNRTEKRLTFVVYDQGVTIPARLPSWEGYVRIVRVMARLLRGSAPSDATNDAMVLRLAMKTPRSSTGLRHRGKGFPAFKEVIDQCERGRLRVVSRCGEFVHEKGRSPNARQFATPLLGTLVEWDLWL